MNCHKCKGRRNFCILGSDDCLHENLWYETEKYIQDNKLDSTDATVYINGSLYTLEQFKQVALLIWYDSSFCLCYINLGLKIYGKTWIMCREEYDGSEGWYHINTEIVGVIKTRNPDIEDLIENPSLLNDDRLVIVDEK